jgi:hypothetical protein
MGFGLRDGNFCFALLCFAAINSANGWGGDWLLVLVMGWACALAAWGLRLEA